MTFEIVGTFAYPGGIFTQPYAINEDGDIAGYFDDQFGISRGFLRYHDGRFYHADRRS